MGSTNSEKLKPASDPSLVLTNPTAAERLSIWTQTHGMWGNALTLDKYVEREAYLTTAPLASDGGITHWILTDGTLPPDQRPILSSCESLRKPAIAGSATATGAVVVTDGVAHGIGSVFTDPQFRGQGYAGRMLTELGPRLREWQAGGAGEAEQSLFSMLYSDIGKTFYASKGWAAFPSTHYSFMPDAAAEDKARTSGGSLAAPLGDEQLVDLAATDEALLRARLARVAATTSTTASNTTPVALLPGIDSLRWHLVREDYMTQHILQRTPTVRGAIANAQQPGRRLWAVWTRTYYGGATATEGNKLHLLRLVLEDLDDDDEAAAEKLTSAHVDGFRAVIGLAQAEAARWHCGDVQLWNPTPAVRVLAEKAGLTPTLVDREKDSIASLMWYGAGPTEGVNWVANEKYGWC